MKKFLIITISTIFLLSGASNLSAAEKAPQKVIDLANSVLASIGTDPIIIDAVKAENTKGKTLDQIKDMDQKWRAHAGIDDLDVRKIFADNPRKLIILCGNLCHG